MEIDFDKFKSVTGYDIKAFFKRFSDFSSTYYQSIINYYAGGQLNQDAFFELDSLLNEVSIIEPLFGINTNRLDTLDMWEILDLFSETQIKLYTVKQTGKWMKSSRLTLNDTGTKINRVQNQNETIEMIADDVGYADIHNDWVDIAINNQVVEEEYTMDGGTIFTIVLQNNFSVGLDNIVDYLTGKSVLGKDIARKINFVNNDLETVNFEKAIDQSFKIKIEAQKNSIPEFPFYGVDNESIGTNVASISYPVLFKDLLTLFKQDKRWSEVNLIDIKRADDSIKMQFEAKSILKDSLVTNINI
jgi:hypothetical protein